MLRGGTSSSRERVSRAAQFDFTTPHDQKEGRTARKRYFTAYHTTSRVPLFYGEVPSLIDRCFIFKNDHDPARRPTVIDCGSSPTYLRGLKHNVELVASCRRCRCRGWHNQTVLHALVALPPSPTNEHKNGTMMMINGGRRRNRHRRLY